MHRTFKRLSAILLTLLCISTAYAADTSVTPPEQASQPSPTAQETPSIQVSQPTHDFGEALEGAEVVNEFHVKNTGRAVLQIEQVRPG